MEAVKVVLNLLIIAALGVLVGRAALNLRLAFKSHEDRAERSRLVKRAGMGVMGSFGVAFLAFAIGEPMADPGGWKGAGIVASWLVPLTGIGLLIRFKPDWAKYLLGVLTVGAVSVTVWAILDENVRRYEDSHGPVTMVVLLVVAFAAAGLGYYRPRPAAAMLLACALVPVPFAMATPVEAGPGLVLYLVVGLPMAVTAVLYLAAERISTGAGGARLSGGGRIGRPKSA